MLNRLLVIAAVGALVCGAAGADTMYNALVAGADNTLRYQNPDGGFPWFVDPDGYVPADPSNQATSFAGRGLVAAYKATGLTQYLDAANEAAQFLNDSYGWSNPNKSFLPFDVTFAYELAAAGGKNYVVEARNAASAYVAAQPGTTAVEKISYPFRQSWAGANVRTLGQWVQVGALFGSNAIYSSTTGTQLASDLNTYVVGAYSFQADLLDTQVSNGTLTQQEADQQLTKEQIGVVLSSYYATGTAASTDALAELKAKLESDPSLYFTPRELGEFTHLLALPGDGHAALGTQLLLDWQNAEGAWIFGGDWNAEHQGMALLGLATANLNPPGTSAPPLVPEPATAALFALGMAGVAAVRRKRR